MNWEIGSTSPRFWRVFFAAKEVAVADGVFSRPLSLKRLGVEQAKQLSLER